MPRLARGAHGPTTGSTAPDAISFNGEDFGRTGDLTVHVPLIQAQNLVRRVPFIVELRNVPFRQQEQIAFYLLDRLPRFTGGAFDARGNGQYLAEVAMQRYGASRIQQVMLSEGGIASICHRLKRRWKMHARWSAARRRHPGGSASRAGHQGGAAHSRDSHDR